ncbi:MAG: chemotaxis protein CheW [Candidatus Margulisiibacteriota bacterium]|nr:MAG: chemotaxis protein CheW [Candidatus Margulisbacteria bacterium GWD2_39_127]OGI03336.1 MAG: chemotaxis protein CheW [Candidatus Margulisbacteria bacterium GWF2_38_17]OGI12020.1 MAG: chemotaxis protein CheW [Candidatus Margulisbacteria bacterium GWE2_39_32]PZM77033.1 MAG: chemotaxis protein CheW [Candidatus Margulisiibacteriota bacterium]HAR63166.1 chemotaxis protein CheW [Candidatus Margulisiibacteriota bacterium]
MSVQKDLVISEIEQLVVFDLAGEQYGVDIQSVQEIIRMQNITKVPKTQEFVEGIINLRGKVIPVLDLRKRFSLDVTQMSAETRIVVIEITGIVIGMIVDAVSEVLRIPHSSVEPPSPIVANIDSDFIKGVGKLDDRLIIILDVHKIFSNQEKDHLHEVANKRAMQAKEAKELKG